MKIKRKHVKQFLVDYSFGFLFSTIFYTPLGLLLWDWSIDQSIYYILTTIVIAAVSGRLFGGLLNKWRGIFGERQQ